MDTSDNKQDTADNAASMSSCVSASHNPSFNETLLDVLACPVSKTPLIYDKDRQELISEAAELAYPIRNGIPVLLKEEARSL